MLDALGSPRVLAAVFLLSVASLGCVDGGKSGKPVSTPEFVAENVKAYGETAAGLPPDVTYGWQLRVTSDVARWRECTSVDACGNVERSRPASDLLGIERVGEADVGGERVEVMKLSLSPRPTYVVPAFKPAPR